MFNSRMHGYITLGILSFLLILTGVWYASAPLVARGTIPIVMEILTPKAPEPAYAGKHVVVNTKAMTVELKDGTSTLQTFEILSIGKPGSYYETIGGVYEQDYKIKQHFSSIGHVYMPWSVHVFGNYFIHGIPFYPDGTVVSSTYSGGCVRLKNEDAEAVYTFVEKGMPIILTQGREEDFLPTATSSPNLESMDTTRLMSAIVSLEVLSQDNIIRGVDGESTTRRKLLPRLLSGDDTVSSTFAKAHGEATYLDYMNTKAKSLGMTNTTFTSLTDPVITTKEDIYRFNTYIETYKSYLLTLVEQQG